MKKHGLGFFFFLLLSACAHTVSQGPQDVIQENWRNQDGMQPDNWTSGASDWFLSGRASVDESNRAWALSSCDRLVNYLATPIYIRTSEKNRCTLRITGDSSARARVLARVQDGILYFEHNVKAKPSTGAVAIYLEVPYVRSIKQYGAGQIEARNMRSGNLSIEQSGAGSLYLSGASNLAQVMAEGSGKLVVLGARATDLSLKTNGNSRVYLNGRMGLRDLTAQGSSVVTIMGASGQTTSIQANQDARVRIAGFKNQWSVAQIQAQDRAQLFLENIYSRELLVKAWDQSWVGARGGVQTLTVNTQDGAQFAGMNLKAQDAFVRAEGGSHSNIWALNKMFALSKGKSSIYYFGDPARLSDFTFEHGLILPMEFANRGGDENSFSVYRPYAYRKENTEQVYFHQKGLHKIGEAATSD